MVTTLASGDSRRPGADLQALKNTSNLNTLIKRCYHLERSSMWINHSILSVDAWAILR